MNATNKIDSDDEQTTVDNDEVLLIMTMSKLLMIKTNNRLLVTTISELTIDYCLIDPCSVNLN